MLDRTIAPSFGKVENSVLPNNEIHHLDNGLPVYVINAGRQELLKVELVFPAGDASSDKKLVAAATSALMEEGTTTRTGAALAEAVDYYGSHLQTEIDADESAITLFTLNKYLQETLPVLAEVYHAPSFPEEELEVYARNHSQSAEINEQKVSHLASRALKGLLYGTEHPLGRGAMPADYLAISRQDVSNHFQTKMNGNIQHIMVAGKLTSATIPLLNSHFGKFALQPSQQFTSDVVSNGTSQLHLDKADAVQNAIRVGRVLFNRNHQDYTGMQFLTTVLGGYFGSRLMANIREDKGYTYGIGAGLVSMRHTGHLNISTEVGKDVSSAALAEIFFEIEKLRNELVPQKELETVRNYLLGVMLKGLDGPFALATKWRSYLKYGVGSEAHTDTLCQINEMTSTRLLELAQRYLQEADLKVVTAGAKQA